MLPCYVANRILYLNIFVGDDDVFSNPLPPQHEVKYDDEADK